MAKPKFRTRPVMGRPQSITPSKIKKLVKLVRDGICADTAAACVGVNRATVNRWIQRGVAEGDRLDRGLDPDPDPATAYCVEVAGELGQARAAFEADLVKLIMVGIEGRPAAYDPEGRLLMPEIPPNPRLGLDYLARRYPTRWSERPRLAARELVEEDLRRLKDELDESTFKRVADILLRGDAPGAS